MTRFRYCLLGLLYPALCQAQGPQAQAIDSLVRDSLKQWHVPGLAVATRLNAFDCIPYRKSSNDSTGEPCPATACFAEDPRAVPWC